MLCDALSNILISSLESSAVGSEKNDEREREWDKQMKKKIDTTRTVIERDKIVVSTNMFEILLSSVSFNVLLSSSHWNKCRAGLRDLFPLVKHVIVKILYPKSGIELSSNFHRGQSQSENQ